MSKARIAIIVIFAAACLIRFADAFRPINQASWRECDIGSIARNFAVESMDPLYPRIDWRGNGPGYTEMEFPLYPWLIALTYKAFGIQDVAGRLWSLAFSIGTLFFFFRLARENLSEYASIGAFAFFAFNPLILQASTAVQPEALMMLGYVAAAYYFLRWIREDRGGDLWFAAAATALALLGKATAGHIGILFAVLLFQKYGFSSFTKWRVWLFGAIAVMPAAAWYVHAHSLWTTFGNSLGVSNEYHWVGPDLFTNPYFVSGILRIEAVYVWVVFGLAVGILGAINGFGKAVTRTALIWLASAFLFYVVTARTSADDWASYYHLFSVPAAALLFGVGLTSIFELLRSWADNFSKHALISNLARLSIPVILVFAAFVTFLAEGRNARSEILEHRRSDPSFQFAADLSPKLAKPGLILVSGGSCTDDDGYPVAYNASFMFYWLDRKGSNICVQDQSIAAVKQFDVENYQYFIAERIYLSKMPGFEKQLLERYRSIAGNEDYEVFDLTTGTAR